MRYINKGFLSYLLILLSTLMVACEPANDKDTTENETGHEQETKDKSTYAVNEGNGGVGVEVYDIPYEQRNLNLNLNGVNPLLNPVTIRCPEGEELINNKYCSPVMKSCQVLIEENPESIQGNHLCEFKRDDNTTIDCVITSTKADCSQLIKTICEKYKARVQYDKQMLWIQVYSGITSEQEILEHKQCHRIDLIKGHVNKIDRQP
jgi:hypothetical protein